MTGRRAAASLGTMDAPAPLARAETAPPARADAARNRAAILDAADRLFHERGVDVPLAEIAAAAGVSRTTLHRHFAGRSDLATALFEGNVAHLREAAAAEGATFEGLLDLLLSYYVRSGGLAEAVQYMRDHLDDGLRQKAEIVAILLPAATRAVAAGRLRPEAADAGVLMLLQRALSGAMLTGGTEADRAARAATLRSLLLDGLRPR